MRVAVVGAGVLGLTLAYRLGRLGHSVEVFEASPEAGGLACTHDYGNFHWDRFYHCILPGDRALLGLIGELGLKSDVKWTRTGTGYYGDGRFYDMNGNADFLRFPLLTLGDKARLAATVIYATRFADPWKLYKVTAEEWLTTICGKRGYEVFWRPLLRAKFGPFYNQVAAVFIWATLKRLFGARSQSTSRECLGYVSGGGYGRILGRLLERFRQTNGRVHLASPVTSIAPGPKGIGCAVETHSDGRSHSSTFDQVFFTGPTRLARKLVADPFKDAVDRTEKEHPMGQAYLGVACLVLTTPKPLTPYYVLNIGDERINFTGVIEMTNLIDRRAETGNQSLIYVPRYMDSNDPRFDDSDEKLQREMMSNGVERLFPNLAGAELSYCAIHRARFVQPLPLVRSGGVGAVDLPTLTTPFQVLNTSMLTCATLNNNEVVGLVDRFIELNRILLRNSYGGVTPTLRSEKRRRRVLRG